VPFRKSLPILDMMMLGHVSYPLIDPSNLPASLSPRVVRDVLRKEWKFTGCTVTDDMDMGAIVAEYGSAEAAAMALKAGNDLMLVCHNIPAMLEIAASLAKVPRDVQEDSYARVCEMRKRLAPPTPFSMEQFQYLDDEVKQLRCDTLELAGKA
jgi:beta-N-acetylhexosaminidase